MADGLQSRRAQHEPNRDDVIPWRCRAERKDETSASYAAADPLSRDGRRVDRQGSGFGARAISTEAQRRSRTAGTHLANRLDREDDGAAVVRPRGGNEINGCTRWCISVDDIELKHVRRDMQGRAAAERRDDGHTAARSFGSGCVHRNSQQPGDDRDREHKTHIAGEEDRRLRTGCPLGLERPRSLRLLLTPHAFARQKELLWRAGCEDRSGARSQFAQVDDVMGVLKFDFCASLSAPCNPPE